MKTRIIYTKIWEDEYFYSLDDKEQLAFLYLLTNSRINLSGIYELNDANLILWLRSTNEKIQQIKTKFQNDNKFIFYQGWVKVVNYDKYNSYSGNLNEVAKIKEINLIPQHILKELDTLSIPYQYPIDTSSNKKSEIRNKKSEEAIEILEHYNATFSKTYKTSKVWFNNFATWREIYSVQEIKDAITTAKSKGWLWKNSDGTLITPTPELIFRTKNRNGVCDYIGQLLQRKSANSSLNPL